MHRLARLSPRKSQVMELRYFGGLNVREMAELLGVSISTISREQKTAEACLSPGDGELSRRGTRERALAVVKVYRCYARPARFPAVSRDYT